jgi:hypothetical protein
MQKTRAGDRPEVLARTASERSRASAIERFRFGVQPQGCAELAHIAEERLQACAAVSERMRGEGDQRSRARYRSCAARRRRRDLA